MTITAKVICDSISPDGIRLSTIQLRYPRMIHSEIMTHRVFSRNGRSSRAVPMKVLLKEDPYTPFFMMNEPGMVATKEFSKTKQMLLQWEWKALAWVTKKFVGHWSKMGVHKQWANRPLEWFGYIDVLITSTEWNNFFALRDEDGAQPEIKTLAVAIKEALNASTPNKLNHGEWHMPYIKYEEDASKVYDYLKSSKSLRTKTVVDEHLLKISTARCARLTIRPFDGDGSVKKELQRYEKLMVSRPVHASPAEHVATPDTFKESQTSTLISSGAVIGGSEKVWTNPHEHGNFTGWRQYRKMIPNNTVY